MVERYMNRIAFLYIPCQFYLKKKPSSVKWIWFILNYGLGTWPGHPQSTYTYFTTNTTA